MKKQVTIQRYSAPERINHWITAFCFVLAAVSGLGFFFPSFNWLMHILGTPQLARILRPEMRILGGDYSAGAAAGKRRGYLASLLRACFLNPGNPRSADGAFICRSSVNCGYYGPHLRRTLGERHDYRDGGRLGHHDLGEKTPSEMVS